ncbi:hypothetical protein GCM10009827_099320 [Dactylosporangium maewongense]|uniref:Uncharacterized protein n=1 Tax=Dactylosporangium maewongense TaxID=634393 RepID=A0ABP4NK24_9ACTN
MSSQPTPSQPSAGVDLPLHRHEWDRLVRLPRHVLVVASAGDANVDAVAGVEAIAAGQRSRALLVRGVVAAIFAEHEQVTGTEPLDREGVLAECGAAVRMLAARLGADVALAYGEWLMDVAASVGRTAWRPGVIRLGGVEILLAEREFVNEIGRELALALHRQ